MNDLMSKKRKHNRRQHISEIIITDSVKDLIISGMSSPIEQESTGGFSFYDEKGDKITNLSIEVGEGYVGENKQRTVTRIKAYPEKIVLQPEKDLGRFELLFACDTNSDNINNEHVSVSTFVKFSNIEFSSIGNGLEEYKVNIDAVWAFEFTDATNKPELIGWKNLIDSLKSDPDYNEDIKIGIVVDSELGRISKINSQTEPIMDNYYLPKNFELIYASDRQKSNLLSKIISECHKTSSQIICKIKNGEGGTSMRIKDESKLYNEFRKWEYNNMSK